MGYSAEQIRGAHHRQFCPDAFYQQHPDFWEQLSRGELKQGKFERIDAHGNTIWLEATYNPIHDKQGQIIKVVKFTTDITRLVQASEVAHITVNTAQTSSTQTEKIAQSGLTPLKQILEDSEQATHTQRGTELNSGS